MGRIRTFDIVVDNSLELVDGIPVYRPGCHVTGVVHLTLNAPRDDVKEISIKFQGRAKTVWSESVEFRGSVFAQQSVTFSGTENYINEKISLWQQAHPRQRLNRGPYVFPFQCHVPDENLPPAYEGLSGHVRYHLTCEITGDSPLSYAKVSKAIAIAGHPLSLNSVLGATVPVHGETESLLSSLCCTTGSIKVQASADRRAYVPGETAYISAIIRESRGTKYDVLVKLIEKATFRGTASGVSVARAGTCQRSRVIALKKTNGVLQRRGETTLQREPIIIPNDRPIIGSGFQGCSIIDINYFINVAPIMSRLRHSDDAEIWLPITIGHVPFTALPSYHASNALMSHPNEPPPSYETATSFSHTRLHQAISNTAYVNQAYSTMTEETTTITPRDQGGLNVALPSLAPSLPRDIVSNQTEVSEEQRILSRDHLERSTPPRQTSPVVSPATLSGTEMGIHGLVNPSFAAEVRVEEDTLSQVGNGEPAVEEQSPSDAEQQQETAVQDEDVLQAPLPAPSIPSPTEDITTNNTVAAVQANQHPEIGWTTETSQEGRRDRTLSQESNTVEYFLPAYERQMLGRVVQTDNYEQYLEPTGMRLQSFFLPIHQDSDSVNFQNEEILTDQIESNRDTLPPHIPLKDEQPSLSIFPAQEAKIPSSPEDNVQTPLVEVEPVTASSFKTQESAPAIIKTYTWKQYVSMSTEIDQDFQSKEVINLNVQEHMLDSEAAEVSFMPVYKTPERSNKFTTNRVVNSPPPLSDFAEGSFSESSEASLDKPSGMGESLKQPGRPSRLTSMSRNKESFASSPLSPLQESLTGNVRIVYDNSQQEPRTPSPYFHPDDGSRDQDEVSSVSSFGSYSPTTYVPKERRRTPRDKDHTRAKSSDPLEGGRGVNTLPMKSSTSSGLRESALGSLDRRSRVLRHSTSHPVSQQQVKVSASNLYLRPRGDPRKVQHTISLPTIDWQDTKSSVSQRLAARLDSDDASHSRKQALKIDPSRKVQSPSQLSRERLPPSAPMGQPSHNDMHNTSRSHPNLLRSREDSIKKRSSYTSAIGNLPQDETLRQVPPEKREVAASEHYLQSLAREDNPGRMKSCLVYAYLDADKEDKLRFETFV